MVFFCMRLPPNKTRMDDDQRERRHHFRSKLSTAWDVPAHRLFVPTTQPLHEWIAPRLVSTQGVAQLNWSVWLGRATDAASAVLQDLLTSSGYFVLWSGPSPTTTPGTADADCHALDLGARERLLSDHDVHLQTVSQLLRDELAGEEPLALFRSRVDCDRIFRDASHVIALRRAHNEDTILEGVCVLQADDAATRKRLFDAPMRATKRLEGLRSETSASTVVYLTLLLSDRCPAKAAATRVLRHVRSLLPSALIVCIVPPVLSTLRFYWSEGFRYAASLHGPNLLDAMLPMLEAASQIWHSGFPLLTYLDPHIEDSRVRLSHAPVQVFAARRRVAEHVSEHIASVFVEDRTADSTVRALDDACTRRNQVWLWMSRATTAWGTLHRQRIVEHAQDLMATARIDSITLICDDPDVYELVRGLPLPHPSVCYLESPVWESVEEYTSVLSVVWSSTAAGYVPLDATGDHDEAVSNLFADDDVGGDAGGGEDEGADTGGGDAGSDEELRLPLFRRDGTLHRTNALNAVVHTLLRRNMYPRNLTVSLRPVLEEQLGVKLSVRDKGLFVANFSRRIVLACIFTRTDTTLRVSHIVCSDDTFTALFALLLRLSWSPRKTIRGLDANRTNIEDMLLNSAETDLFNAAMTISDLEAFASTCVVKAGSSPASPVSLCKR